MDIWSIWTITVLIGISFALFGEGYRDLVSRVLDDGSFGFRNIGQMACSIKCHPCIFSRVLWDSTGT